MAEEKQQSPGAGEQPLDNVLNEPSVGMVYDKEKDQAKVFSQNPDGSIGMVDPTPENESLFFVMDKNIPLNFYKNLEKYHNNPTINIYVVPRRALGRMKNALKRYWNRTTSDDVKLYYNYKMRPDGQFECKMKTRGIRDNEIPWNTLASYGLNYGALEQSGNLRRMKNYEPTGMLKLNYFDNIISGLKGDAKLRLSGKGDRVKVDFKFHTNTPDKQIDGVNFTDDDLRNLEMYGNLGRVFETPENRYLVSRDFDTQQIDKIPVDKAFMPRFIYGTELKEPTIDAFKRGEASPVVIADKNGNVREVLYQYNVVFRKPMPVITLEQRNALADNLRQQRDLERIISQPEEATQQMQYPQTPKQSAEQTTEATVQGQTTASEQSQQGQATEAAEQGQAPAPEQSLQGQTAEAAGHEQAPTAGLSQQGQAAETVGQGQAPAPQQNQHGQATAQGQTSQQGQRQPGAAQKPPRPQVSLPANKPGRRKGKHL